MAMTTNHANNELVKYAKKIFANGYVRENPFERFQSESSDSVIRLVLDLEAGGKEINITLSDALQADGVGSGTLSGNEEAIDNYGYRMWPDFARHAVKISKKTKKDASWNVKNEFVPKLNQWIKKKWKDEFIYSMLSIPQATAPTGLGGPLGGRINGIKWSDATAGQKNNWMDANADRVLFGSALANYVAGNFASSVANVDSTNDRMSGNVVVLAKRIAQRTIRNKITPKTIERNGQESYILFCGSNAMRDLMNSSDVAAAVREAFSTQKWSEQNPLFRAGDVWWRNVLVVEIPDIGELLTLTGVGASSINVEPFFFCGQNAFAHVAGQMPIMTELDNTDYGFNDGAGIEAQYGVGKIAKVPPGGTALIDWGIVTGFVASINDA
jgi:hypothetical protein